MAVLGPIGGKLSLPLFFGTFSMFSYLGWARSCQIKSTFEWQGKQQGTFYFAQAH